MSITTDPVYIKQEHSGMPPFDRPPGLNSAPLDYNKITDSEPSDLAPITIPQEISGQFANLLNRLHHEQGKPFCDINGAYSTTIADLEKVAAYFQVFCVDV